MEVPESAVEGSYAMSDGSSPRGDAGSEISGFTSASQPSRLPSAGPTPAADLTMDRSALLKRQKEKKSPVDVE